ncbi:MAG: leucine--tRNA ligase [Crenarchaeota archaeon]|nr:leucine--tRNA ligase [Thermoproteota archaeon]
MSEFLKILREIEAKWQREWYDNRIFEPVIDEEKTKFFVTVPYPYVSGPPHIGHGRTFTIADIIARFKRMLGYNVLYPIAWHITGTPIQAVADLIAKGDPDTVKRYREYVMLYIDDPKEVDKIIEEFKDGWKIAMFFAKAYERDFKSVGLSMDFSRQFTTGDPDYNAFIIWQYQKLREKGYITRGRHVVLYAPAEGHAVGEHDIKGGDEIEVRIQEFVLIKFKLSGTDEYVVAATLRPETIFGVTNIWIRPDAQYVRALVNGEVWIVSKECAWKLQYQDKEVKMLEELKGENLIGRTVIAPLVNREIPILPAWFVDPDVGTGIVFSVPAHAPYDYAALIELKSMRDILKKYNIEEIVEKIEPISIIESNLGTEPAVEVVKKLGITSQLDKKLEEATKMVYQVEFYTGKMRNNTPLSGVSVQEAREKVKEMLREVKMLDIMYEVEPKGIVTRSGNKIIAAVIKDQWFIDYRDPKWKERALKLVNEIMRIVPDKYRQQFNATIRWLELRPCARRRGLGTRLPWDPEWIIESLSDSTIYMAFYTIVKKLRSSGISDKLAELVKKVYEGSEDAINTIEKFFDYIFLGIGDSKEVAKLLECSEETVEDIRREFLYWYPVDLRHSGIDLIPSHLTFFIMHHTAIFPENHWPRAISLNENVIREGRKMSKTLGNVLEIARLPRHYSADLFRLYVASSADLESILDWRESEVQKIASQLERFWKVCNAILELGPPLEEYTFERVHTLSKKLISIVNMMTIRGREHLENFRIREYVVDVFFNLLNEIEEYMNVYKTCNIDVDEARYVLSYVIERWIRMLQPIIPHICEEIWHKMGKLTYVSCELWPSPGPLNWEIINAFEILERTLEDIKNIIKSRETRPRKIYIYVGPSIELYDLTNMLIDMLERGMDMRSIMRELSRQEKYRPIMNKINDILRKIISGVIPRIRTFRDVEYEVFKSCEKYISYRLGGIEVEVQDAEKPTYDPAGKARQALPGRPAIYVEW